MKQKLLITLIIVTAFIMCGCSQKDKKTLTIGSGDVSGTYYSFSTELSKILTQNNTGIELNVRQTAGSAANIRLISKDFLDYAIVQSDILTDAVKGANMFSEDGAQKGFSAVAALYTEAVHVVVKSDSDINSIEDLKGKRVSLGAQDSGVLYNATQILNVYGLNIEDVNAQYLTFTEAADAMRNDTIDAFFVTAGTKTPSVKNLSDDIAIRFIEIDGKEADRLCNLYPGYVKCNIPADSYTNQSSQINTVGVKAVLIANDKISDDTVKNVLSQLYGNIKNITAISDTATLQEMTEGISYFHPGAVSFYKENGINDLEEGK